MFSDSDSESESESYCDVYSTESYDESECLPFHAECNYSQDNENDGWQMSPRCLKSLSALAVVQTGAVTQLSAQDLPANLYPGLLCEACRLRCGDSVSHLVATWPYPLLNLGSLQVPLDASGLHFTRAWGQESSLSLAEMVVRGLLNPRPECRIKRLLLPHSDCEGSEMTKIFSRLPYYALRERSRSSIKRLLQQEPTLDFDVDDYLKEVPKLPFVVSKSRQDPLLICLPGVLQWVGRHRNYRDVLVGLTLQSHTPFHLTMDRLLISNALDLSTVSRILSMVHQPQKIKKITFSNKKQTFGLHVFMRLGGLEGVLGRFSGVECVRCRFEGVYVGRMEEPGELARRSGAVLGGWGLLTDLTLTGNLLVGRLANLLGGLTSRLLRLNLSATGLNQPDLHFLAHSPHIHTLHYLNLDHIDLNSSAVTPTVTTLFSNMRSLVTLRTCSTGLNAVHAAAHAHALSHLTTLTHWSLLQNPITALPDLLHLIHAATAIPNLHTLGCKPFTLHAMFTGLQLHTAGAGLTQEEAEVLRDRAREYKITVY